MLAGAAADLEHPVSIVEVPLQDGEDGFAIALARRRVGLGHG
jgi:hypothetical protein